MPTVIFEPSEHESDLRDLQRSGVRPIPRAPLVIDAPEGGSLADLCDTHEAPVPFSCRSANCGTCRVVILEGMSELAPPEAEERSVLDLFGSAPTHRLACCITMRPGLATLRLRPVDDGAIEGM
jgi:ferredoxin